MALFKNDAAGEGAKNLPRHIAIILDGNGRWAKKRGLPRTAGHAAGPRPSGASPHTARTSA